MFSAHSVSPLFAAKAALPDASCATRQNNNFIKFPSSELRRFAAHQSIFTEGERSAEIFEVLKGVVMVLRHLSRGRRQILAISGPGSFIGLKASEAHDCSAIAMSETLLYRQIDGENRTGHRYGAPITAALFEEVHRLRDLASALGRKTALERLACFLGALMDEDVHSPVEMVLPVSRQEIADHLGLALETVCRNFTLLKNKGVIRIRGSARLTVLDPAALRRFANEDCFA
jgi:CRP-like cAMP-binding protein